MATFRTSLNVALIQLFISFYYLTASVDPPISTGAKANCTSM